MNVTTDLRGVAENKAESREWEGLKTAPDRETVNHPPHYNQHPSGVECITVTEHMGFNIGNAVKYLWRADLKGDAVEDLRKAAWYVGREIERRGGVKAISEPATPEPARCTHCGHPTSWHWCATNPYNVKTSLYHCTGHQPDSAAKDDCPCREPWRFVNPNYACRSCNHLMAVHSLEGCRFTTKGRTETTLVCPCVVTE